MFYAVNENEVSGIVANMNPRFIGHYAFEHNLSEGSWVRTGDLLVQSNMIKLETFEI